MASKKKRNKRYTGQNAATTQPQIVRLTAANRSKLGQWWFERKKFIKPVAITVVIVLLVIWCIIELVKLVF